MAEQLPQPRISVVIPAYNEAAHIEACLRSLKEQDIGPVELLVIDDGSSDGTAARARQEMSGQGPPPAIFWYSPMPI